MTRELLVKILTSQGRLENKGTRFAVAEGTTLEMLLTTGAGTPVPIPKVEAADLADDFLILVAGEDTYCLPYANVLGLKLTDRGGKSTPRAGFLR